VPVYVYRRRDGASFELDQPITSDALALCPTTGQTVERVLQPFSLRFKGHGFYSTEHPKVPVERDSSSERSSPSAVSASARDQPTRSITSPRSCPAAGWRWRAAQTALRFRCRFRW
jgi:predicted nucleic acid-binding Zn ribbon protein